MLTPKSSSNFGYNSNIASSALLNPQAIDYSNLSAWGMPSNFGSDANQFDTNPFTSGMENYGGGFNSSGLNFGGMGKPVVPQQSWLQSIGALGTTDSNGLKTDGWGGLALGAASGLMNGYMGMKKYGLAKDQLATSKDQFNKNYTAQAGLTNASLEDRYKRREADAKANGRPLEDKYAVNQMAKYGVKG